MSKHPPRWADRFLEWYCHPDLLEDIQGDLYEMYERKIALKRPLLANMLFIWYVFRSFRPGAIKKFQGNKNSITMTGNNFKIAFRVMLRDKFNTFLNLGGLAIGVACFILLGFFAKRELSFDRFHAKSDKIYRVWLKEVYAEDKIFFNSTTPIRFENLLEEHFGEVETAVQLLPQNYLVGRGDDRDNEVVTIVSPEFFEVFDFQLTKGNSSQPLTSPGAMVISESHAVKYFGSDDPIGRVIPVEIGDEIRDFNVTAVFEDIRTESSIQFNMAISNVIYPEIFSQGTMEAWFSIAPETYVLIGESSNISTVEAGMQEVVMGYLSEEVEEGVYNIGFQPLTDIHLNADIPAGIAPVGNRDYVYILGAIAILVLVIACVNYTTLSIGQSLKRSGEVGIRKVMGALKGSLVNQYLSESLLTALFALIVGVGASYLLLPIFNDLTQANISLQFETWHIGLYAGLIIIMGIASGIYPAFILSRLNVTAILRGSGQSKRNHFIRKGMVVFQFMITVFLITSTLIMNNQLRYIQGKDVGYNYSATVSVPLYPDPSASRFLERLKTAADKGELLKEKLSLYPEISNIGKGSHVFGTSGWARMAFTDDNDVFRRFRYLIVDASYFSTFDIKMKAGRGFEDGSSLDEKQSVIINQAAADYFGLKSPVGSKLPSREFGEHSIIGVTENFNFTSLHNEVEPLVISQDPMIIFSGVSDVGFGDSPVPKLVFRYEGSSLLGVREILDKEWETTFPGEELNFTFVEDDMQQQYAAENRMSRLVTVATILSIIIAALGLLGLTVLVINSKVKEIGIRKVVGASVFTIFWSLARSFSTQLIIGIALSIPITWWLMTDWLSDFAYRINIGVVTFIISAIISAVIALLVISFHTLRAALVNPVKSLRVE